jgi:hypothetical protein
MRPGLLVVVLFVLATPACSGSSSSTRHDSPGGVATASTPTIDRQSSPPNLQSSLAMPTGRPYPAPVKPVASGALATCPNPAGLRRFTARDRRATARLVVSYGRESRTHDLRDSDPSWWPNVLSLWKKPVHARQQDVVLSVAVARSSAYRIIVRHSCGRRLLGLSAAVTAGPTPPTHQPQCEACKYTVFMVNRFGHPLIYFVY